MADCDAVTYHVRPMTSDSPSIPAPAFLSAVQAIAWREWVRFFRQRSRVIGAFATPVIFWVLLGFGADRVFDASGSGIGYREYFFPGALVMILLFTAIFSTITVIDDRNEGFLQGVLVSPAPRSAIVLGKVIGGAGIAMVQGLAFLALFPLVMDWPGIAGLLAVLPAMLVLAIALTGLGLVMAWRMDSTAGYHALMNILLMPMWFLSGAVFPASSAPGWMKIVMALNPLTYGHQVIAGSLLSDDAPPGLVPMWVAVLIVLAFASFMVGLATKLANQPA